MTKLPFFMRFFAGMFKLTQKLNVIMSFIMMVIFLGLAWFVWSLLKAPPTISKRPYGTELGSSAVKTSSGKSLIGGSFELIDQDGNTRSDTEFRGKYMMVYFGYSYCPDICPTGLASMTEALEKMGKFGRHIQPIFITLDAQRDKVPTLKKYMKHFHPRFVALTGSEEALLKAKKAYRVYSKKIGIDGKEFDPKKETAERQNSYLVDHSSIVYLMDRNGNHIDQFSHNTPVERMVEKLQKIAMKG